MKKLILVCTLLFSAITVHSQTFVQPGNKWYYIEGWWDGLGNGEQDTVTYTALTDTLLDGRYYHRVRPAIELFPEFFRVDSAGIWVYNTACSDEWLYYAFNSPVGLEYRIPMANCDTLENSGLMNKEFDTTDYSLGESTRLMTFLFVPPIGDGYRKTITPKFGFTGYSTASMNAMYYKGLMGCIINGVTYGVIASAEEYSIQPEEFTLKQNYPNPFNPSTTIEYELKEFSDADLRVYDNLGREIKILLKTQQPAGKYSVKFDASGISSGVYFYKLTAGGRVFTKSMVLVK